jgi:hypothetical protein
MAERRPAYFTGVSTYQDPLGRFSVRYPTDWHQFALDGREGVMFAPDANDLHTALTAWVAPLEHPVAAEDLEELKAGVAEGLARLPDCRIESASEVVLGNLIKFERVFTLSEDGVVRKRKLWLLYVDKWLISLTWQGATEADYEHWFSMANYSFATFNLPEALWFATDRDLVGHQR